MNFPHSQPFDTAAAYVLSLAPIHAMVVLYSMELVVGPKLGSIK